MAVRRSGTLVAGLALGLLLVGCAEAEPGGEAAACSAPTLSVQPGSTTAGGQIVVHGENFLDGCPEGSLGERDTIVASDPAVPYASINLQVLDGVELVTLAMVDAGEDGTFEVAVQVPRGLDSGVIEVTSDVEGTAPASLVIGAS